MMTSRNKKNLPTLDLHGMRLPMAIRSFTDFAEQHSTSSGNGAWIKVITGTGQHSPEGPVLRGAIEKLLVKRLMEYQYNQGCFVVNCSSGMVLTNPRLPPTSTKIRVIGSSTNTQVKLTGRRMPSSKTAITVQPCTTTMMEPLPRQVAANDTTLQKAKNESVTEFNKRAHAEKLDQKNFAKAVTESQLEAERQAQVEKELLERALSISEQSHLDQQQEEQMQLEQALTLSQMYEDEDEETKQLEQALLLSQQDIPPCMNTNDEQRLLQQAITLSLEEHQDFYVD